MDHINLNNRPKWVQRIAHNFNDDELNTIEWYAKIDSCAPITVRNMIVVPSMLGAPVIIPEYIKTILKDIINHLN